MGSTFGIINSIMSEIILILDNIRSTHNVGSILRSADGFGIKSIIYTGYTPYPLIPDDTRLPHESTNITRAIHKTALGAEITLGAEVISSIDNAIEMLRGKGFVIAALEQSISSVSLSSYKPPQKLAIILGNEVDGIKSNTLSSCDVILEIPMFGTKESFNVAVSAALCMYELSGARDYAS